MTMTVTSEKLDTLFVEAVKLVEAHAKGENEVLLMMTVAHNRETEGFISLNEGARVNFTVLQAKAFEMLEEACVRAFRVLEKDKLRQG